MPKSQAASADSTERYVSTSPLQQPDVPGDAADNPLFEACRNFHACLKALKFHLSLERWNPNFDDLSSADFLALDREYMLAQEALEMLRVNLNLIEREFTKNCKPSDPADGNGTLFGKEQAGPYGGDRR